MKSSVVLAALGTAQTLAWGASYYLPAILPDPIAAVPDPPITEDPDSRQRRDQADQAWRPDGRDLSVEHDFGAA
jgi:hypothetical protein